MRTPPNGTALDRDRLRKLLGLLGSDHDGEVLNAARLINALVRDAGSSWHDLIPDLPGKRRTPDAGDLEKLDQLLASEQVTDVLKLRLRDMRSALQRGRLGEGDRRLLRILHRKAVVDGAIVEM